MVTVYTHSIQDLTLSCSPPEFQFDGNLPEYLLERCRGHVTDEKTTWTIDTISGESFTFAEFDVLSGKIASAFCKRGMKKGDIVIYMCYDIVKLHIFFNGVWRANGVLRSVYPEELENSILETVVETGAKWILCEASEESLCLSVSKKVSWHVEVITTGQNNRDGSVSSIYDFFQDDGQNIPEEKSCADDPALILCTSGTTGKSKGAAHSHKSVIAFIEKNLVTVNFCERNLYFCKGTHVSGALLTLCTMPLGKTLLTMSHVTAENVFKAVNFYKPNFLFCFPAFLTNIIHDPRFEKIDRSSIEYILAGGTDIKPSQKAELMKKFANLRAVTSMYGLTETVPCIGTSQKANSESLSIQFSDLPEGSIGKVLCGTSLQIRDETGTIALGPNKDGEICVKNTNMFSHYYKQEEETAKAFTADGWFRTGDIGFYNENGFIFFSGRQKEMFKCSGNHVFPALIDDVISKHPSVADVCTVGVEDPAGDKMPRAFVVLKQGVESTSEDIKQFAHRHLPTYKYLRGGLFIVPSLPKGSTGKITRFLVAQLPVPEQS